jgi:hypothetical protein
MRLDLNARVCDGSCEGGARLCATAWCDYSLIRSRAPARCICPQSIPVSYAAGASSRARVFAGKRECTLMHEKILPEGNSCVPAAHYGNRFKVYRCIRDLA